MELSSAAKAGDASIPETPMIEPKGRGVWIAALSLAHDDHGETGLSRDYPFRAPSASATAVRISATENGFVTTSWTIALRPWARSR